MATKTYQFDKILMRLVILIMLLSQQVCSKTIDQQLMQWTHEKEAKLIERYSTIKSQWFESVCLQLTQQLSFTKIFQCRLIDSENINAYVFNNGHVYFTYALLKQLKNKHQFAAVLAHENAHVELKHYFEILKKSQKPGIFFPKRKIKKLIKKNELEADMWSEQQLKIHNLKYNQVYYFLKRVNALKKPHVKITKRSKKPKEQEVSDEKFIQQVTNIVRNM